MPLPVLLCAGVYSLENLPPLQHTEVKLHMKNRKKEFKDCNLEILFRLPFCLACSINFRLKTVHSTLIQISSLSTCQSAQSSLTPSHGMVVPHDDARNRPWALQAPRAAAAPGSLGLCTQHRGLAAGRPWKRSIWHLWATSSPAGPTASLAGPLFLSAAGRTSQ